MASTIKFPLTTDFTERFILPDMQNTRVVVCLLGEPAIGKTSVLKGLESLGGFKVFTVEINTLSDPADLTGMRTVPDPNKNGRFVQVFFPHQTLQRANDYALEHPDEKVVIVLDEINRTDANVTSAALTMPTARRCGDLDFADNVRFAVTGNDEGNVTVLDSASVSRFVLYKVKPMAETFLSIHDDLHASIRKLLTDKPELIFDKPADGRLGLGGSGDEEDENGSAQTDPFAAFAAMAGTSQPMSQFAAPRTIHGLSEWLNAVGDQQLVAMSETTITDEHGAENTELLAAIMSHTGRTLFSYELNNILAESFAAPAAAGSSVLTLTRPVIWNDLRASSSVTDIQNRVGTVTNNDELDKIMLFALATNNPADRSIITHVIDAVTMAKGTSLLDTAVARQLLDIPLNRDAVAYLVDKGSPITSQINPLMGFLTYHT